MDTKQERAHVQDITMVLPTIHAQPSTRCTGRAQVEKEATDVVPLMESMFETQGAEFERGENPKLR
jgi:hypothetical protein